MPVALNCMDGAIILVNCISTTLVHKLLEQGKPVISVSYNYYPLQTESVFIDNAGGVRMTLNHLKECGHTKIGFAGDTHIADIALRFEAYKQFISEQGFPFTL